MPDNDKEPPSPYLFINPYTVWFTIILWTLICIASS